jgi:3-deoxy-D-manno-octulosonate 8-phosphate phosphatase (KDO 8-P phosphatase)
MHADPRTVRADALAVEAAALMEKHRITSVLVVDEAGRDRGRAQHQRPDAREGHLMPLAFQAETLLAAQDCARGLLRHRRRADRRRRLSEFTEHGEPCRRRNLKRFSILDGYGLKLLRARGHHAGGDHRARFQAAARTARGAGHRACALRHRRQAARAGHARTAGLRLDQAAAIGDDWPDLPVLTRVGFAAAPANAHVGSARMPSPRHARARR